RSWTASELRVKSFEDLHKLWYILLKERNLLATMFEEAKHWNKIADKEWLKRWDDRKFKTQKSMARIRHVLSERRVAYEYAIREDPKLFGLEEAPKPHIGYREEAIPNKRRTRLGRKTFTRMRRLLLMRYLYPQSLDSVFMESLHYVDITYIQKHTNEQDLRPPYTPALERYEYNINYWDELKQYLIRTGNQIAWIMMLYFLSLIPLIGALVYPIASAYALVNSLGYTPAFIVGTLMYVTPGTKPFAMIFLEILYSSRALMRELLEPYFGRIKFDKEIKKKWFKEREGILFGFSIGYYFLIRLPLVGMLFYGIAQAAATLLLVKVTEPPPPPGLEKTYKIEYRYTDPRTIKKKEH
ncbi:15070_t:CDS:2, partial [Dentiscutata heterogama]